MEWFYDKHGQAVFFKYDDRLISKQGANLCWIFGNYVYSLNNGRHIGWFEDGKIYDIENGILAFLRGYEWFALYSWNRRYSWNTWNSW